MGRIRYLFFFSMLAGSFFLPAGIAFAAEQAVTPVSEKSAFVFRGIDYEHRWSKGGQHEFTPPGQADLSAWLDMITINIAEDVRDGEQLALLAKRVLSAYQRAGKVLRTDSKPRTTDRAAEHLVVVVLGTPKFLETVFARFVINDGTGTVILYARRVYGNSVGPEMSEWLLSNGLEVEQALMSWDRFPLPRDLKRLPQSH